MTKIMRAGEDITERPDSPTASTAVSHAQHSPLPWRAEREDGDVVIRSADGMWIATMQKFALMVVADDGTHNAVFVMRACNHHEALLAVIRDLLARFVEFDHASWSEAEIAVRDRALAAINSAEGK